MESPQRLRPLPPWRWVLAAAALRFEGAGGVPAHSKFQVTPAGVIELLENPQLRLNSKGGKMEEGDQIVLWPCAAQNHEIFDFAGGLVKLRANPLFCLNAQGGTNLGAKIVTWPCSHRGFPEEHEGFEFGKDGRIRLKKHPDKCITVKEGRLELGTEVVLWKCGQTNAHTHDRFVYKDGLIQLEANRDYHLNLYGGDVTTSAPVVLWTCAPGPHEIFEFTFPDNRIRLKHKPELCLNAEGGLAQGSRLVLWPCHAEAEPHEKFVYDKVRQVIHSQYISTLAFNVKGGTIQSGAEIILWTTDEDPARQRGLEL